MNNKIIRFFNYESAFDFYTKKIKGSSVKCVDACRVERIALT